MHNPIYGFLSWLCGFILFCFLVEAHLNGVPYPFIVSAILHVFHVLYRCMGLASNLYVNNSFSSTWKFNIDCYAQLPITYSFLK